MQSIIDDTLIQHNYLLMMKDCKDQLESKEYGKLYNL